MTAKHRKFWPATREATADRLATATAMAYVGLALALGFVVPRLRHGLFGWVNRDIDKDQVTTFLSSVSGGMMAFTGIIFSLLFVMLQFSSSAYSPHLLPMLSRNRTLIHAGGVFTGTFLYSLMALRGVGIAPGGGTPGLVLFVAFTWLIASVFLLLRLVRVFSGLAITDVLEMVGDLGWSHVDRTYSPYSGGENGARRGEPESPPAPEGDARTFLHRGKPRYVIGLDVPRLLALAVESGAFIRVLVGVGDAVTTGVQLAIVRASGAGVPEEHLRAAITLDRDRTLEQGPKQAIRLLVDIAIRALSPAINDPTTAVHALDQIESMLVRIGNSDLDIGTVRDEQGTPRVWYKAPTWEDYLDLALTEIRYYGAGAVQIERRLAALLSHVREQVPEERREAVARLAAEQRTILREAISDVELRAKAERLDRQGIGGTGPSVVRASRAS
jgi:uncharacterized membrane protein